MDQQLQLALIQILNGAVDAAQAGVSFLQAEVPDVVQQLLTYKLVASVVGAVVAVAVIAVAVLSVPAAGRLERRRREWDGIQCFAMAVAAIAIVVAAVFLAGAVFDALEIWLAPKLYLIEYAADIVKAAK